MVYHHDIFCVCVYVTASDRKNKDTNWWMVHKTSFDFLLLKLIFLFFIFLTFERIS